MHSLARRAGIAFTLALPLFVAVTARADGAFPDSSQLLLPADKPNEIILATNFGLLISQDAGASWQWVCEQAIAPCARLYQLAPPPSDKIFAVSTTGLVALGSDACEYSSGLTSVDVGDAFIDPTNALRVLALGAEVSDGGVTLNALFASSDGGQSFGSALYTAPAGSFLTGVEIARSTPTTVYLTERRFQPSAASILRSTDGGLTFQHFDQSSTVGPRELRIAAVDPADATHIYFRAIDRTSSAESLAISSDGGMTTRIAQALPAGYVMTTFLRRGDGTLLVGGLQLNAAGSLDCTGNPPYSTATPVAYRSSDGGKTFVPWAIPLHLRGLGERGATLYAAADNFADGFAVGSSTDGGQMWKPLLKWADIGGPLTCQSVASTCAAPWVQLQTTFGIMPGKKPAPMAKGGCSYSLLTSSKRQLVFFAVLVLIAVRLRRARRAGR